MGFEKSKKKKPSTEQIEILASGGRRRWKRESQTLGSQRSLYNLAGSKMSV